MRYLIVKYIKTPDGKYQEQAQVLSRVHDRDWSMAAVILDYQARTVVKAVIDGKTLPKSFDRFDSYYREFFPHAVDYLRTKHQHQGTETTGQVEQISD
jgi:hypothetical protein